MEDKGYAWFLKELSSSKIPLKILETGICRGNRLLSWFYTDSIGAINQKVVKENSRAKQVLDYFLNKRVPILEEYNPEKVICYLYHRKGVKIVSAKDAIDLAENQLHGLQVRSIHMALSSCMNYHNVYRMSIENKHGEISSVLTYGRFSKDPNEEVKDPVLNDKATSLSIYLCELICKCYQRNIKSIKIDLIQDAAGQFYIIKLREMILSDDNIAGTFARRNRRKSTGKIQGNSSEEVSFEDPESLQSQIKMFYDKDLKRKEARITMRRQHHQNSNMFLEMIAKTFDRERKTQETLETLRNKRFELENNTEGDRKLAFKLKSYKSSRELLPKKQGFNSINDVLYYVEKTRPRVWVKDSYLSEVPTPTSKLVSPACEKVSMRDSVSDIASVKSSSKMQGSNTVSSFRKRHQKNFANFLSEEENRLRLKMQENRLKVNKNSGKGRVIGHKTVSFGEIEKKVTFITD